MNDYKKKRPTNEPLPRKAISRQVEIILLTVIALAFVTLALSSSVQKSPTVDEPLHLFAGYSYLKWGDYWVNPEHPPLAKLLAALPLMAMDIKAPHTRDMSDHRMPQSDTGDPPAVTAAQSMLFVQNDADILFFYAKLPMIALAGLLGCFIYLWSKQLFGSEAAIVSTLFFALDPNILAHSPVVHTDLSFAAFFMIGSYYYWRNLNHVSWHNLLFTVICFGLAAITKHSFPAILLTWIALGMYWVLLAKPKQLAGAGTSKLLNQCTPIGIVVVTLLTASITAYLFIWAAYGFRFHAIPRAGQLLQVEQLLSDSSFLHTWIRIIIDYRIFPEAWVSGQLFALKRLSRASFLLGEISEQGFWSYFAVVFAVKTPLPTLVLSIGSIWRSIVDRQNDFPRVFLLIPVLVYFTAAILSGLNIGMRHILPIYPFLFILIGGTVAELWEKGKRVARGGAVVLLAYYLYSSFSTFPHYFAFFNELVGGPTNGHKVLLDSNLDWGQDLPGLKQWMDRNGVKNIHLLYFGKADPQYYGINAFYLPGSWVVRDFANTDVPEYLAISANFLYGDKVFLSPWQRGLLKSFQLTEPVANIGYSILVYKLAPNDPKTYHNMGLVLASRGHLERAAELFGEALKIHPGFAIAHENLARILTSLGKHIEANTHHEEALRIIQSSPQRRNRP